MSELPLTSAAVGQEFITHSTRFWATKPSQKFVVPQTIVVMSVNKILG